MEFAIENAQTLKKRAMRRPRQQALVGGSGRSSLMQAPTGRPRLAAGWRRRQQQTRLPRRLQRRGPPQAAAASRKQKGKRKRAAGPPATPPVAEGQPQAAAAASRKQRGKRKRAEHAAERRVRELPGCCCVCLLWRWLHRTVRQLFKAVSRRCLYRRVSCHLRAVQAAHAGLSASGPEGERVGEPSARQATQEGEARTARGQP